jgi:hypothetical protein
MVKTMESYYVETLSRVYVHGAPWIFKPIWAILKPLLDPVVRDKVRLTFSAEELAEHIPFTHLPKDTMRGGMDWTFEYPRPDPNENDKHKDIEARDRYQSEYMEVAEQFEQATKEVTSLYARRSLLRRRTAGGENHQNSSGSNRRAARAHDLALSSDDEEDDAEGRRGSNADDALGRSKEQVMSSESVDNMGDGLKARRDVLATKLRLAFLRLKPYVVGKSMVDRWGAIKDDGRIVWQYRSVDGDTEEQVLGLGTTLPELERNMELIEQASGEASGMDNTADMTISSPRMMASESAASHLIGMSREDANGNRSLPALKDTSGGTGMNRRQLRLINRSRPASGGGA